MLSEETRQKLAAKLNKIINIPLIGEDHEQMMAEQVIDLCLANYSDADIEEMKNNLKMRMVEKLNAAVNIPFANEAMEAKVLSKVADFILKDTFDAAAERDDDDGVVYDDEGQAAGNDENEDGPVAEPNENEAN
jgi:hypothetical protein